MKALDSIAHRDTLSAENIAEFTFASNEAASSPYGTSHMESFSPFEKTANG